MKVTHRRIRLFSPVEVPSSSREEDRRDLPDREPGDDGDLVVGGDGSLALKSSVNQGKRPLRTWTFSSCIRGVTLWSEQTAFRRVRSSAHSRLSREAVCRSRQSGTSSAADTIPFGEGLRDGLATGMVDACRVCTMERLKTEGGA
jgi:hypothetical protein